jgi:predicted dehydrogenase
MSLKVAIVGCGKIADAHVEEIAKLDNAYVVGACDRELIMAEQLARRYGIPSYYDDLDRLLEAEKPDVLHITTPPQSHLSLVVRAVDAGCHVYVEKPLAVDLDETRRLITSVERANKKLTVGLAYYFDPVAVAMREYVADGRLGEVVHVECFFGYDLAGDFGRSVLGNAAHWVHGLPGKLFQNNLDHPLGDLVEFMDAESAIIHAFAYRNETERFGDARDDVLDELRVFMKAGTTSAYCTFSSHARPRAHLCRMFGTRSTIEADYVSRTLTNTPEQRFPSALGRLFLPFASSLQLTRRGGGNVLSFLKSEFQFFAGMGRLIDLFYDSIIDDSPPPIAYKKILRLSAIQEEIYGQIRASARRTEG